jgi:hypothetical protein
VAIGAVGLEPEKQADGHAGEQDPGAVDRPEDECDRREQQGGRRDVDVVRRKLQEDRRQREPCRAGRRSMVGAGALATGDGGDGECPEQPEGQLGEVDQPIVGDERAPGDEHVLDGVRVGGQVRNVLRDVANVPFCSAKST